MDSLDNGFKIRQRIGICKFAAFASKWLLFWCQVRHVIKK
ncbi:Uncharacterised protein [Mycobacteroides abscessus subsp. abscessus]|nr:Uncharacterised protein [Mycobacteroides abscessus subsp. abscessus]